jgi:hypothetical protein
MRAIDAKIAVFSKKDDLQAALIVQKLKGYGVDFLHYLFHSKGIDNDLSYSVRDDGIYKNGLRLSFSSVYMTGFYEELPNLINEESFLDKDLRLFNKEHACHAQWHSFDSSFVRSSCFDAHYVINPFETRFLYPSSLSMINALHKASAPCPQYVCVSSFSMLSKSPLSEHESLLFSHTSHGSPMRSVYRENYEELFKKGRDTMILLMENIKGQLIRLYVLDGKPLLALNVERACFLVIRQSLETFTERDDLSQFVGFSEGLYNVLGLNFLEAELIIKDDGEVLIMSVIPDVLFASLGKVFSDYIAENLCLSLLEHSSIDTKSIKVKKLKTGRQTLKMPYLSRMLKPYNDAFQRQESRKI